MHEFDCLRPATSTGWRQKMDVYSMPYMFLVIASIIIIIIILKFI